MVTGRLTFIGENTGEVLEAIFTKQPVAPVRLNQNVPNKLEEIINKALEKDRNLRYATAVDMRTDLQRLKRDTSVSAQQSVHTTQVTVGGRDARTTSRKLWVALAAAVVILAGLLFYWRRESTVPETKTAAPVAVLDKIAIAVLPFTNLSADKDQEYFSDGLTEELLNVLAKNPTLQVTSRTSAFSLKERKSTSKRLRKSYDASFQIAEIYAYRGESDKAFEWLERAYKQRHGGLTEMKGDPLLRNIQKDPRYTAFLKKMNLPVD
jgi:eukaryotic-like serine/threonine-protein kinase